ncbi:myogenesis-regulating glycosidase-like [Leptidea sinapis]|uniref:myogenesis-regulating glycosidase-like n=1 Tax=Leptidea sinapis TaxID=189913 RepID=UPI0021C3D36F|nr:myogenesis-regulating glycosidase-like [Leptidea sinapis]
MERALLLFAVFSCAIAADIYLLETSKLKIFLQNNTYGGFNVVTELKGIRDIVSVIGRHAGEIINVARNEDIVITFENKTSVRIRTKEIEGLRKGQLVTFDWESPKNYRLEDCVNLGLYHWYGGPQQKRQFWPIERLVLHDYSYVTKEADNCAIAEPYWLNSNGIFFYFDKKVPLFIDQNNVDKNAACFIADVKPPYSNKRETNELVYALGIFNNPKEAHEFAVEKYLKKPTGIPDESMISYPVWSTWARYKKTVDHDTVIRFADEIIKHGFKSSHIEIDDLWESCYGSQVVDSRKFPDLKNTVESLKSKGFRVTIWLHPFVNKGCEPWYSEAKGKGNIRIWVCGNQLVE